MRTTMALAALLALSACSRSGDRKPEARDAQFCPGCKVFCGADCPTDSAGACKACGRTPVKAQTCELRWYACTAHGVWHAGKPCGDDAAKDCCEASKPVMAICVPVGTQGVEKVLYCPTCRGFCGAECPVDAKGACAQCGRTPVEALAIAGPWHWCEEHKTWHQNKVCKANDDKQCCTEVRAKVLACHPE